MPRRTKTREQRATDDLEVATRVAKRAGLKRDLLKTQYDAAVTAADEADKLREFAASNPFLPQIPAPVVRRTRAPRDRDAQPPVDRVIDGKVVEKAATG